MSALYRTPVALVSPGLSAVRRRYDDIAADLSAVDVAPPADRSHSEAAARFVVAEARWLDARSWTAWLTCCSDETVVWVPLRFGPAHPGSDQSLFYDDRRRLDERLWRFADPNAWALHPPGVSCRVIGGVEAWPGPGEELLCSSTFTLGYVRGTQRWLTTGRQVHRLRPTANGSWTIVHKIIQLVGLAEGFPHLGWLL